MSMQLRIRNNPIKWFAAITCLLLSVHLVAGQPAPNPETHELLNGLKIMFWPKSGSSEVLVKLRIHSGSAFDLAGKAGEMALLGDILFPDPATIDYFTEQMGGKLNVAVNFDSMTITMIGKAEQLDNILEVLRNAILGTQLTPEVVNRVRETRIKIVKDTAVSPSTVADRAIGLRLFGDFPYGRPTAGNAEGLARVDRGDLMLARERFLNSNNATLAIVGGVSQSRAIRALKQLLGPWRKSEQIVPTTFQAAKTPDTRTLIVNLPTPTTEVRVAWRGLARSDKDYYAAQVLAKVAEHKFQDSNPAFASKPIFVRSESYLLPGIFVMGTAISPSMAAEAIALAKSTMESLITNPPAPADFERAKREMLADSLTAGSKLENEPDPWLDVDTYRLSAVQDRLSLIQAVSVADIQRVANRLVKDTSVATVVVGDAPQLKSVLQGHLPFEVLGETTEPAPTPKAPAKPAIPSSPR